ncbi:MAG: NYN domain-containing protein, partial [Longimicrobiales bacterium]
MSAQFAHAPHRGSMPTQQQQAHHPHAALLIDFDNVTMGIRSDLSKELKNLLSSDIIKGKVAVQRAYADWRRYPQYIVPLAESSVDLIFAPAYGSSKKNATDIRLAIDALELVFTRPEIGSFILLSGDSDFSSLVLKLKEYGKYVIGVGIRESASDLLVQNCDEYYSYSALTGLTRAGDEPRGSIAAQDPWELVETAVNQMAENNDVMRSDRLKQVMLEMDPTFDEKALGFQKFNRFMQDAAGRGMVSLKKLENGQFEIGPAAPGARADAEDEEQRGNGQRARRSRRGGRGRGRDRAQHELPAMHDDAPALDEDMALADGIPVTETADDDMLEAPVELPATVDHTEANAAAERLAFGEAPAAAPDTMEPAEIMAESPAESSASGRSRRGRGRGRGGRSSGEPAPIATGGELPPLETAARDRGDTSLLKAGYTLLRQATKDVLARGGSSARDSDVKRRMLEIQNDWDEHPLGFSKFSRFLRQAHDAEVINLHKSDTGYDLTIGDGGGAVAKDPSHRTGKTGRTVTEQAEAPLGSQVTHAAPVHAPLAEVVAPAKPSHTAPSVYEPPMPASSA